MAPALKPIVLDTYDYVWDRFRRRLEGLTDEEFLWEPVPDCLTVRRTPDGIGRDHGQWPDVQPSRVSTIAWRICHIADNFLEPRIGPLFGRPAETRGSLDWPITASDGIVYAEHGYAVFRRHLDATDEASLWQILDDDSTPYRGQPLSRFVLQYLEELAHHAAEVALLRDLHRARFGPDGDPLIASSP
ncbi:MAG TPA: DinB family protein [Acidimicrobiales bacterium]|nr:DinB family protein [Acidimicrobiales bacterium]